jgi:aspartate/methionine/tyrosine aminotransferase
MLAEFRRRRDVVVAGLNGLPGVTCVTPRGAFYVFPNIRATGVGTDELADRLLTEAGVAVLAGTAFGEYGEGYLRLSYANSLENIEEALVSIRRLLEESIGV